MEEVGVWFRLIRVSVGASNVGALAWKSSPGIGAIVRFEGERKVERNWGNELAGQNIEGRFIEDRRTAKETISRRTGSAMFAKGSSAYFQVRKKYDSSLNSACKESL